MSTPLEPAAGFAATGLSTTLLSILDKLGLVVPTPIQAQAIPVGLKGGDIVGIAQTGTGKTLAFSLPMIEQLLQSDGVGLIIAPTRELALQVEESVRRITNALNPSIRTVCLIGGMPIYRQIRDIRSNPRVIIATPGRLQDHLNQRTISLENVSVLILDEADRMLDMGFAPQIEAIISAIPTERQTMMFSATMAPEVSRLINVYTRNATWVKIENSGDSNALIRQELCYVAPHNKVELLQKMLEVYTGSVLIFSRTKDGASVLRRAVREMGYTSAEIHSNCSLRERRWALDGFKSGQARILIATDIAARGIDVPNISLVINYDLPDAIDDYVHRIGRTGRAGSEGLAISFAGHNQRFQVKTIERLINKPLIVSNFSEAPREPVRSSNSAYGGSNNFSRRPAGRPAFRREWSR